MGRDSQFGSLSVGKFADLIVLGSQGDRADQRR
jgi:imidazolonepropionase-like amidohydrolase